MKQPCVYMLASRRLGTIYIGVTSDLIQRTWQHRNDVVEGFSQRYRIHRLIYFELHVSMMDVIEREKELKKWRRAWKIALIERDNPEWQDLWLSLIRQDRGCTRCIEAQRHAWIPGSGCAGPGMTKGRAAVLE